MNDEALRQELTDLIRARNDESAVQTKATREADAHLSDEEWWERGYAEALKQNAEFAEVLLRTKADIIARRHETPRWATEEVRELVLQKKVAETLPHLVSLREEEGATGPITEDQYYRASMHSSFASIGRSQGKFAEAAARLPEGFKRDLMSMFVDRIELDLADMRSRDFPPTEDQLSEVTMRIVERTKEVTDFIKKNRKNS